MERGYIYILINPVMPDIVKIGKTTRLSSSRAREIEADFKSITGLPYGFRVAYDWEVSDCNYAERFIHQQLKDVKVNKEWFSMPLKEAIDKVGRLIIDNQLDYISYLVNLEKHLKEAKNLFNDWNYQEAIDAYRSILKIDSSNETAISYIAVCQSRQAVEKSRPLAEIIKPLEDYLACYVENHAEIYYQLCCNSYWGYRWDEELEPDELPAFSSKLIDWIDTSICLKPEPYSYVLRGNIFDVIYKNKEMAIADYSKAIAEDSDNIQAYEFRAHAYADLDNLRAKDDLDKCVELNPGYAHFYYSERSKIKMKLEDYTGALEDLLLKEKQRSINVDDLLLMGDVCIKLNDQVQALIYFDRAFETQLKYSEPFHKLQITLARLETSDSIVKKKSRLELIDKRYKQQMDSAKHADNTAHFCCQRGLLYAFQSLYTIATICFYKAYKLTNNSGNKQYYGSLLVKYTKIKQQSISPDNIN